jgi:hypothetical protein
VGVVSFQPDAAVVPVAYGGGPARRVDQRCQIRLTPWRRTDEHLPLSHIAEVAHTRGFFWDAISVESSGGANPLWITGVSKSAALYFVDHVRARLNESIPPAPR